MLTNEYIVGLTDGEGCFHVYVKRKSEDGIRKRVVPMFVIKLKAKDKILLDKIKKYFDFGTVYIQRDKRKNHSTCYRYQASARKDINKIIKFFSKNKLRSKTKQNDFRLFCEIVNMINRKQHYTEDGLDKIISLKNQMH